nr:MAG TPA: hypothetical protein [Caudoviricetes sp.]
MCDPLFLIDLLRFGVLAELQMQYNTYSFLNQ